MSIQVPVDEIEQAAADYGRAAYVLVSSADGPPRITHSPVEFAEGEILVSIGRRAATALTANPRLSILWPATESQSMSLIVDGDAAGSIPADGGEIRVSPSGGVRHRPASG